MTSTTRPIRTYYMVGDEVLKTTASGSERNAVANALYHAHTDEYNASYILVYDFDKGKDLTIMHRTPNRINILYKAGSSGRDIKESKKK